MEKKGEQKKGDVRVPAKKAAKPKKEAGSAKKTEEKGFAEQAEVNIGLVGHVDHGKTSLTEALTGKWTDTHSEELKRGISIRLGYADVTFYKCRNCKGQEAFSNKPVCALCGKKAERLRKASFVDAPGHETLMTTMLSGAALMNGAVLVIAANEKCPQPQTEEHLMALKMSGVENIVVAQNKVDLVEMKEAVENRNQIKAFLEKNGYKDIPIIPISANFSGNIDLLIEAINERIPTPDFGLEKPLLMFCARSFDVNRPGARPQELKGGVIGGTIIRGKALVGEKILIRPGIEGKGLQTEVRSLSCSSGRLKEARAGGLVALGTGLDSSLTQNDRMRGQVIGVKESMPEAVNELEVELNYIKRLVENVQGRINSNEHVVLTVGTMAAAGLVTSVSESRARISLKSSVVMLPKQKIAVSKKSEGRWQLVAYAIAK